MRFELSEFILVKEDLERLTESLIKKVVVSNNSTINGNASMSKSTDGFVGDSCTSIAYNFD